MKSDFRFDNIQNEQPFSLDKPTQDELNPSSEKLPKKKKGLAALLGVILAFLGKSKFGLIFLKVIFPFLKFGKFLTTFLSMLLMIWIYAKTYGIAFGVGFVLLIFIHEMGHYLTAKKVGLNVSAPLFIPFVGAFITMKEQPSDAVTEARIALGGPVWGTVAAFLCASMYPLTGQNFWLALAYSGFLINMFNLIPFHPLDGGRIVSAISPKMWFVGVPLMLLAALKFFNPFLFLLLILGISQIWRQWRSPQPDYYATPLSTRFIYAVLYFGLIILLGVGMAYVYSLHGASFPSF